MKVLYEITKKNKKKLHITEEHGFVNYPEDYIVWNNIYVIAYKDEGALEIKSNSLKKESISFPLECGNWKEVIQKIEALEPEIDKILLLKEII